MSNKMSKRVWEDKSITDKSELLVMLALADSHNPKHGCFPSLTTLMKKTRLSRSGVCEILTRLEDTEKLNRSGGGGRGKENHYTLYPPKETVIPADPLSDKNNPETVILEDINSHPGGPFIFREII
jgi:hypothetical protein